MQRLFKETTDKQSKNLLDQIAVCSQRILRLNIFMVISMTEINTNGRTQNLVYRKRRNLTISPYLARLETWKET